MSELQRFWKFSGASDFLKPYEEEFEAYLFERYQKPGGRRRLKFFYLARPVIPRSVQIMARRVSAKRNRQTFPAWPREDCLESKKREMIKTACRVGKLPFIWFWPAGNSLALVLTHDVETEKGLGNIMNIIAIEKRFNLRSSWNFVVDKYELPYSLIERLLQDGFEVGIHGLKHDGKLFSSRAVFDQRVAKMRIMAERVSAVGFRSPSLLRNAAWIRDLPFEYDSSFPDTDPYGPQPGGCLSVFPYFIGTVVELPVTLAQDHTLFEILGHHDISVWKTKLDWIERMNGLALIIVHPDYTHGREKLDLYEEFLRHATSKNNVWCALPRDACRWWKDRDRSSISLSDGTPVITGPARDRGAVAVLQRESGAPAIKLGEKTIPYCECA